MSRSVPAAEVTRICARRAQALDVLLDQRLERVVGQQPRQRLGMFVADVEHAGAALQDGGQFRRVHQAFDRAVHHQRAAGQRGRPRAPCAAARARRRWSAPRAARRSNSAGQHEAEDLAPSRAAASRASSGSTGRLWLSLSTATVSPGCSAQRPSTASKASSQAGSMVSCSMECLRFRFIIHENSCNPATMNPPRQGPAAELLAAGVPRRAGHVRHRRHHRHRAHRRTASVIGLTANSFNSVSLDAAAGAVEPGARRGLDAGVQRRLALRDQHPGGRPEAAGRTLRAQGRRPLERRELRPKAPAARRCCTARPPPSNASTAAATRKATT